jgi:hypothetical protein
MHGSINHMSLPHRLNRASSSMLDLSVFNSPAIYPSLITSLNLQQIKSRWKSLPLY